MCASRNKTRSFPRTLVVLNVDIRALSKYISIWKKRSLTAAIQTKHLKAAIEVKEGGPSHQA
jgi:hypothetical protein